MATRSKRLPESTEEKNMDVPENQKEEKNMAMPEDQDVESLLKMLKTMQQELSDLKVQAASQDESRETTIFGRALDIRPDDYIKVISLCPYKLNLSTKLRGEGRIFGFNGFGEVKRIRYSDLIDILEVHDQFLKDGFFAILDKEVIQKHDLESDYGNVLTKENIESILEGNQSDAVTLFKVANDQQRNLIVLMFMDKIMRNEEVNLNFLDRISRVVGYSIHERALQAKEQKEITLDNSPTN